MNAGKVDNFANSLFFCCCVVLCGWAAKADDSFVCFGAKPDKGFLDMKFRRIRKWEGDANESWLDTKELRGSWRGTRKRGSWRWTGSWRRDPGERQLALNSREAVGGGTAERVGVEPRTGAVNTGLRRQFWVNQWVFQLSGLLRVLLLLLWPDFLDKVYDFLWYFVRFQAAYYSVLQNHIVWLFVVNPGHN